MPTEPLVIQQYFDGWNDHDADRILGTFTSDGSYNDPIGGANLAGEGYAAYCDSLFLAFPDLHLELISSVQASSGWFAVPWVLRGTHKGPVGELAGSGNSVVLPGCDFILLESDKIKCVKGYFDPQE